MRVILGLLFFILTFSAYAEDFKPKFVSLKNSTTNVRAGPGTQYPILWVFKRKGWPVKAISKYQYWYKIIDNEGETGWIYKNLISNTHTVIVSVGEPALMYHTSEADKPIMKLSSNVILRLNKCNLYLCEVAYNKRRGWVSKSRLLMVE